MAPNLEYCIRRTVLGSIKTNTGTQRKIIFLFIVGKNEHEFQLEAIISAEDNFSEWWCSVFYNLLKLK